MSEFTKFIRHFASDQRGASMVEYAVLCGLLTVVLVAAINGMSGGIARAFNAVTALLPAAP